MGGLQQKAKPLNSPSSVDMPILLYPLQRRAAMATEVHILH